MKEINLSELLRRKKVVLNDIEIAQYLKGRTVLVTGAGSIGTELCRQIQRYRPERIVIFDNYENNIYDLQNELKSCLFQGTKANFIVGSIRDARRVEQVFLEFRPTVVFHAAAHKHVPLMEEHLQEAVKNNVYGTLNMVECADKHNCSKFILISTDKAVNPSSIMGATKRIAEIIIQYFDKCSSTSFSAVRFGNVLESNGSVIPLFKKQIEMGGTVTVTHEDVSRYFMTINEAGSLVIQAGAMANGGEIFILDMGEPLNIADLAIALIKLYGLTPGVDIKIEYIGLRPGEKLHEELFLTQEEFEITKNDRIFIEKPLALDFNNLMKEIYYFRNREMDISYIESFIKKLVPTYKKIV